LRRSIEVVGQLVHHRPVLRPRPFAVKSRQRLAKFAMTRLECRKLVALCLRPVASGFDALPQSGDARAEIVDAFLHVA
jgi:hypothetical protein